MNFSLSLSVSFLSSLIHSASLIIFLILRFVCSWHIYLYVYFLLHSTILCFIKQNLSQRILCHKSFEDQIDNRYLLLNFILNEKIYCHHLK